MIMLLVAMVVMVITVMRASPHNWREGVLYQQVYLPMLCTVQGRQPACTEVHIHPPYPIGESGGLARDEAPDNLPPVPVIAITGIQWVNADTDRIEGTINEGDTLLIAGEVGFIAQTTGPVNSVRLVLTQSGSGVDSATDSDAPYTLHDGTSGDYAGESLPAGNYTLTATAYREDGATGAASPVYTVNFTIETSGPQVTDILLIDATTDTSLGALHPGMRLPDWTNISFQAVTNDETLSVKINIRGREDTHYDNSQFERLRPFAAFGDSDGNFAGRDFVDGTYRIEVIPYSTEDEMLESRGTPLSRDFEVTTEN